MQRFPLNKKTCATAQRLISACTSGIYRHHYGITRTLSEFNQLQMNPLPELFADCRISDTTKSNFRDCYYNKGSVKDPLLCCNFFRNINLLFYPGDVIFYDDDMPSITIQANNDFLLRQDVSPLLSFHRFTTIHPRENCAKKHLKTIRKSSANKFYDDIKSSLS